jgi:diaminohydroxyphosphoribosylaminopyrimidine deaminase/5-amino-6-(5-phosphoribosylamino)uracil reductase
MINHVAHMQRALSLAAKGRRTAPPNPMVGCVVVRQNRIIAEGFHERAGGPHAEVIALKKAGARSRGSTVYVTLEPCTHWGQTPPCAPDLVRAGVKQVVVAMKDPNPLVSGRGLNYLRRHRVSIVSGVLEASAKTLNRRFVTYITKKRSHVVLKMAMTLDGKIATRNGASKWISNEQARYLVYELRADSDAILVGATTAMRDNPHLTSHGVGRNPLRLIVDPRSRVRASLRMFHDGQAETRLVRPPLKKLLAELAREKISQLLVEGGGETAWHFLKEDLIDEAYFFVAPILVGGRSAPTAIAGEGFTKMSMAKQFDSFHASAVGNNILLHALKER